MINNSLNKLNSEELIDILIEESDKCIEKDLSLCKTASEFDKVISAHIKFAKNLEKELNRKSGKNDIARMK
jgi:hypothetical protein